MTPALSKIGTLLETLIRALVDSPDDVFLEEIEGIQTTVFQVRVARSDFGKIVGREGRTANAIRELLAAYGGKANRRYLFEPIDERMARRPDPVQPVLTHPDPVVARKHYGNTHSRG
jgi:uncharacterized protein